MIDFNLIKKIIARLYVIAGLLKKNKNFEPDTYAESKDIFYLIKRIETVVFSGRGEEKPTNDLMKVLIDAFMPIENYEDYFGEEQDLILKDIVAYCLNDIENLKGLTRGEAFLFGNIAEELQVINGVLYESTEFSDSIKINAGQMQEDAWQRLVNAKFLEEDHPRDGKGRFIRKPVSEESVRDEKGKFLSKELNTYIDEVRKSEPAITRDVAEQAKINGVENIMLSSRLKSKSSAAEKARKDAKEKGVSLMEAAEQINDLIRYTQGGTPENLVGKGFATLRGLQDKGYKVRRIKNYWLDKKNPYNGVNVQLIAPDGAKFEIIFNTEHNVGIKEQMHGFYEKARKASTKEDEEALNRLMHEKFDDKWQAIDNIENFVIENL